MSQHPPSPDSYGRVTNPERFAPLHAIAIELLDSLAREFDVERIEQQGLDEELEAAGVQRSSIRLEPRNGAAPIVVVFTRFPGLRVRAGRWATAAFPACGCDACAETLDDEAARFRGLVANVVEGRFREAIVERSGTTFAEWEQWSNDASSRERHPVDPGDHAFERNGLPKAWGAWPRRAPG
jgi:hypothetical protein